MVRQITRYDLTWFQKAAKAGNLPAVSYLKANRANDGHPGKLIAARRAALHRQRRSTSCKRYLNGRALR